MVKYKKLSFLGDKEKTNLHIHGKEEGTYNIRSTEGIFHPCSAKGCSNTGLLRCSSCKKDAYCSVACQRAHWRNHRPTCRKTSKPMEHASSLLHGRKEGYFGIYEEEEKSEEKKEIKSPCEEVANAFYDCVRSNLYPPASWERIFGIQMGVPTTPNDYIGKLVCPVWYDLFSNERITKKDICEALRKGNLPQFFEVNVRSLYDDRKRYLNGYTIELIERHGFKEIPWDWTIHRKLKL
jgi:hypothetical protein